MATKRIEDLPEIKHTDVVPMYSKDEILNRLATAVHFAREQGHSPQRLDLELIYSVAKMLEP